MTVMMWLPPLIRALATALIVVSASAVAEAVGPFWGALIASLPVSAGPAYVFLAMQHGPEFVAASALSSFAANAATGLFLIVYGLLARRVAPWQGLTAAVLAWLVACVALHQVEWTPVSALVLNSVVYGVGFRVLSMVRREEPAVSVPARGRRLKLLYRAVAVAAFVSLVVAVSAMLGPEATGIAAVFPISLISLIVILQSSIGGAGAAVLAANALRAMLGFGALLLTLHLAVPVWGTAVALGMALAVSAVWSVGLLLLRPRLS